MSLLLCRLATQEEDGWYLWESAWGKPLAQGRAPLWLVQEPAPVLQPARVLAQGQRWALMPVQVLARWQAVPLARELQKPWANVSTLF